MIVGVPSEVKEHEYRIALLPSGAEELTLAGHRVLVQRGAGAGSGITDQEYERAGAVLVNGAAEVFGEAELIVKVKEPQMAEVPLLRRGQLLFTYLHLAADEHLTRKLLESGITGLAYETLQDASGSLCLLAPMSEVAGRMSVQQAAKYLERPQGGRGLLLGGVPGVERAHVTVLGGGVVGSNAARVAAGFGASVTILDTNLERLRTLDALMPPNVSTLYSDRHTLLSELTRADVVIGAVLVRGARAPRLVRRGDLRSMKPGAVVVDVAVDQGGCVETTRPTTHGDPTYTVDGIVHYAVANMPGALGRTSTFALCHATEPYILRLAARGLEGAIREEPTFASSVNLHRGAVTHRAVADSFAFDYLPFAA